jgi:hypothetical protein
LARVLTISRHTPQLCRSLLDTALLLRQLGGSFLFYSSLLPLSLRHRHCSSFFLSSPPSHTTQWLPQSATCETTSSSRSLLKSPTEVCFSSQCFVRVTSVANVLSVGGIYSVLKSKAQVTTAEYGSAYTLIGPLNRNSVSFQSPLYSFL